MFGNKYPKLHALRGAAAEAVTDDQLEGVNAELQENGVTSVAVVSTASMEEAEQAVSDLAAARDQVTSLQASLAAAEAARNAAQAEANSWKGKAESYGAQPGAEPTKPSKEADPAPEAEEKVDPFYSEADAELDGILKTTNIK